MSHPYADLEGTPLWAVVDHAVQDLVENKDVAETTAHTHVVGYLCRKLLDHRKQFLPQLQP